MQSSSNTTSQQNSSGGQQQQQQQQQPYDMQRFQQQLHAQYRQQMIQEQQHQQQPGAFNLPPGALNPQMLMQTMQQQLAQQQQQQGNASINGNNSNAANMLQSMFQQQQRQHPNNNNVGIGINQPQQSISGFMAQQHSQQNSGNTSVGGGGMLSQQANAFAAAPWGGFQPQNLQQQQPTQVVAPAMDESTGSGTLLMASMAGGAFGLQPQQQQEGSIHLNPSSRRGSNALQNMQAVLLQQQRAPQQQQQQSNRMAGTDHFLSSSNLGQQQQQQTSGNSSTFTSTSGTGNSVFGTTLSVVPGLPGSSAQQQAFIQQQLAVMQQQNQRLMNTGSVENGSGIATANVALANMQDPLLQHQLKGNANVANQFPQHQLQQANINNASSSNNPSLQPNILQARQQQLLHQMQQMQQRQRVTQQQQQPGVSSHTINVPSSNTSSDAMLEQLRQGGGGVVGPGLAQQMASHINLMLQPQPGFSQLQQQSAQQRSRSAVAMLNASYQQQQQLSQNSNHNMSTTGSQAGTLGSQHGSITPGSMVRAGSAVSNGDNNASAQLHQSMHSTHSSSNNLQHEMHISAGNSVASAEASGVEQRSFLDGRFAGGWQSNADLPDRRQVIYNILDVIQTMRPDMTKLSSKLPHMAKSLEEHLYRSAQSKEDYMNRSTLKKRLQIIAHGLEIHRSSDSVASNSEAGSNAQGQMLGLQQQQQFGIDSVPNTNWSNTKEESGLLGGVKTIGNRSTQLGSADYVAAQISSMQQQGNNIAQQREGMNSNSMSGQVPSHIVAHNLQVQHHPNWPADQTVGNSSIPSSGALPALNQASGSYLSSQPMNFNGITPNLPDMLQRSQPQRQQSNLSQSSIAHPTGDLPSTDQKKRVILQQQQRLLLLRHASKCKAGSSCTTKFCDQMVTLWKHMKACRDKNCTTSHCLSSRCVLNHYRICKSNGRTMTCEVCGPVMNKIKQQERDDGSIDDPLARDQDVAPSVSVASQPQLPSNGPSQMMTQPQQQMGSNELLQLQAQQSKLEAQVACLKLLEKRQEELVRQQKTLEEEARNISDPTSPQAGQLQEKYALLRQLQKRCQQQHLLVQQELQMQTPAINALHAMAQPKTHDRPSGHTLEVSPAVAVSALKVPPPVTQEHQPASRRGSGIGHKHLGKSLALHQAEAEQAADRKKKRNSSGAKAGDFSKRLRPERHSPGGKKANTAKAEELAISPLLCMTKDEIQKHLESLNKRIVLSSRTVTHKCRPIINELLEHQFGWVFKEAVDPVALGLPDYFDVIKTPMHLELVKKKLENAIYSDMEGFARDTRLVFQNAILYNGESSEVGELAQCLLNYFEVSYKTVVKDIETSHLHLESQGELCSLCGEQKRRFEPTVLYCQGKCGMQRIKRNASYFTDRTKQNHWCESCFAEMKANEPIHLDDGTEVMKKDLQIFKNDALPEEGWVNCDECESWVHQICALFNGRTNKSTARFTCPSCFAGMTLTEEVRKASEAVKGAKDLGRCKMSDAIEEGMKSALEAAYRERAGELGVTFDQVEKAEDLSVRVIANVDKKHFVGDLMLQRYSAENCPSEFPVRTKCIALFQRIHGVDTFLFAVYVYEYGQECPAPNKRRVYISYLDSVQYFEPKCYRTAVYQSIVVEYLRYVKKRGFHTAHIWSCPPTPGDDYIFYCHPSHQLVPREDMLRAWYHSMLDRAKALGVVIRTTTLYDEYFSDDLADPVPCQRRYPTCLPYFEGDYIPGEIENIIQQMGAGSIKPSESLSSQPRDDVMRRVGHNLRKMKDNFIVVHLRNRRFAAAVERGEDVSQWKEDSDDEIVRNKRAKITGKSTGEPFEKETVRFEAGNTVIKPASLDFDSQGDTRKGDTNVLSDSDSVSKTDERLSKVSSKETPEPRESEIDRNVLGETGSVFETDDSSTKGTFAKVLRPNESGIDCIIIGDSGSIPKPDESSLNVTSLKTLYPNESEIDRQQGQGNKNDIANKGIGAPSTFVALDKLLAVEDSKENPNDAVKNPTSPDSSLAHLKCAADEFQPLISRELGKEKLSLHAVADTSDEDPPLESEMFESRQQFLNYCQTTHCQFDELRRAKHSTVMVLFQLHNPMAPKFLQQCGACYRDITHGVRYHCNQCSNFDLCDECYEPVTTGIWAKRDSRFAHEKKHTFNAINMEAQEESLKIRAERQKTLMAHVELLEHAGTCPGAPDCSSQNCLRLKKLFEHVSTCTIKPKKECRVCTRLLALCTMHARLCTTRGECSIPFCDRIRERNKRLRRQQQLMDDRRRQAQNELYHAEKP